MRNTRFQPRKIWCRSVSRKNSPEEKWCLSMLPSMLLLKRRLAEVSDALEENIARRRCLPARTENENRFLSRFWAGSGCPGRIYYRSRYAGF